ncbi:MAG: carboxypeptidase-like regulatory domain-containing protein, partial [Candidatus Marinimicrobia bacterium]|nr:carboxypeptidase-like regulatory domain-containing protein [Candidatus Neomarinimicrobiota bacterium]
MLKCNLRKTILLLTLLTSLSASEMRNGDIRGIVVDNSTQQPLPGVIVMLEGTELGTATDLDGSFYFTNLRPGSYHIRFQMMG